MPMVYVKGNYEKLISERLYPHHPPEDSEALGTKHFKLDLSCSSCDKANLEYLSWSINEVGRLYGDNIFPSHSIADP